MPRRNVYLEAMPKKPLDLPMQVAKAFIKDMRRYFAEPNAIKRDEIAGRQLHALRGLQPGKLRIHDIKEMFEAIRDRL
jgi:hypothetical protein